MTAVGETRLKAGVVGLGQIGGGVARALARSGFSVVAYDVRQEALDSVAGVATAAGTPAEVAEAVDVVLVAVVDDAQVEDVVFGEGGILAAADPASVACILSTVSVPTIISAAERAAPRGVSVIDCGVTGGVTALEHNAIVALVGGPADVVELARPILEGFCSPVMHMGPLGAGMRAKVARNAIQWTEWLVVWEAAKLAHAAGIDLQQFVEAIRESRKWALDDLSLIEYGIGLPVEMPRTEMMSQERMEHRIGLGHKDLRAALELAEELGVELRSPALADELLDPVCGGTALPAA